MAELLLWYGNYCDWLLSALLGSARLLGWGRHWRVPHQDVIKSMHARKPHMLHTLFLVKTQVLLQAAGQPLGKHWSTITCPTHTDWQVNLKYTLTDWQVWILHGKCEKACLHYPMRYKNMSNRLENRLKQIQRDRQMCGGVINKPNFNIYCPNQRLQLKVFNFYL